jgi:hypothetical protein
MGNLTSAGSLRGLPSLAGPLPSFDPDTAPADPWNAGEDGGASPAPRRRRRATAKAPDDRG